MALVLPVIARACLVLAVLLAACSHVETAESDAGAGGNGGAGGAPAVTTCETAADCDPSINPCFVGACATFLHRCIFKPSCLP